MEGILSDSGRKRQTIISVQVSQPQLPQNLSPANQRTRTRTPFAVQSPRSFGDTLEPGQLSLYAENRASKRVRPSPEVSLP